MEDYHNQIALLASVCQTTMKPCVICLNVNECSPNPCQNNGTCTDGINSYNCSCVAGYIGTDCETKINDCYPNPCQNGGTCLDLINNYYCICDPPYSGRNCAGKPYNNLLQVKFISYYLRLMTTIMN